MMEADKLTYCRNCKVCIIDSGISLGHQDLPTSGVSGTSNHLAWNWMAAHMAPMWQVSVS